jgi:hypothetical protein
LKDVKGGQIKEGETSGIKDPIWRVRSVEDKLREEIVILNASTSILFILVMILIWVSGGFKFTLMFVIILAIAAAICIIAYRYLSWRIAKDSWKLRGQLTAKCHATRQGFEITQKELKGLFIVHGIETQKSRNLWDIDRKFITKSGETIVIFKRNDSYLENVTIEIFGSKEYPKAQQLIKEFFDVALFSDARNNVYLKTSRENKAELIKNKTKSEIHREIWSLQANTGTPWFIYIFCLYGMLSSGTITVVALFQAEEKSVVFAIGLVSILVFILSLTIIIFIYNMNKRNRNRLKELERKIRTM